MGSATGILSHAGMADLFLALKGRTILLLVSVGFFGFVCCCALFVWLVFGLVFFVVLSVFVVVCWVAFIFFFSFHFVLHWLCQCKHFSL